MTLSSRYNNIFSNISNSIKNHEKLSSLSSFPMNTEYQQTNPMSSQKFTYTIKSKKQPITRNYNNNIDCFSFTKTTVTTNPDKSNKNIFYPFSTSNYIKSGKILLKFNEYSNNMKMSKNIENGNNNILKTFSNDININDNLYNMESPRPPSRITNKNLTNNFKKGGKHSSHLRANSTYLFNNYNNNNKNSLNNNCHSKNKNPKLKSKKIDPNFLEYTFKTSPHILRDENSNPNVSFSPPSNIQISKEIRKALQSFTGGGFKVILKKTISNKNIEIPQSETFLNDKIGKKFIHYHPQMTENNYNCNNSNYFDVFRKTTNICVNRPVIQMKKQKSFFKDLVCNDNKKKHKKIKGIMKKIIEQNNLNQAKCLTRRIIEDKSSNRKEYRQYMGCLKETLSLSRSKSKPKKKFEYNN